MLTTLLACAATLAPACPCTHAPQDPLAERELTVQRVTDTIYRLHYYGANLGVVFGSDGILLIDGGFLEAGPELEAGIAHLYFEWRERTQGIPAPQEGAEPLPYRYIISTHWHNDHTATNPFFALGGAKVIAHPTVRRRLMGDEEMGGKIYRPPMDPAGVPTILVEDSLTLYFNGEELRIQHLPLVHTDGDLMVWMPESKVAFLGDLFHSESFPYIELVIGARPSMLIAGLEMVLGMLPEDAQVVPGHGPATGMERLREFYAMISDCDRQMRAAVLAGKSLMAVYEQRMFGEYEDEWGDSLRDRVKGFIQVMWYCYARLDRLVKPEEEGGGAPDHDHDHDHAGGDGR